jgi:hypothetical protein
MYIMYINVMLHNLINMYVTIKKLTYFLHYLSQMCCGLKTTLEGNTKHVSTL